MVGKITITSVAVLVLTLIFAGWAYSEYAPSPVETTDDAPAPAPITLDAIYIDVYADRYEIRVVIDETDFDECLTMWVMNTQVVTYGSYTYLGDHMYLETISPLPAPPADWLTVYGCSVWDWNAPDNISTKYICPTPVITIH